MTDEPVQQNEPIRLVTTLYPLEYFAKTIGGDLVEVTNLIAPGVEAHDFEPSPHHMRLMKEADIIVYNGSGFEPWMERALDGLNGDTRIVVEASLGLVDGNDNNSTNVDSEERTDPHVWLDLDNAAKQSEKIRDSLAEIAPIDVESIRSNTRNLLDELAEIDTEFSETIQGCAKDTFVTSHSAFGHLADRYGLVQIPLSGLSPESEPSPGTLADMVTRIRESGVTYILAEPATSKRLSETVAAEVGAEILPLHPLESLTPDQIAAGDDFMSIMLVNLNTLKIALECAS